MHGPASCCSRTSVLAMRPDYLGAMVAQVKAGWLTRQTLQALARIPDEVIEQSVLPPYATLRALQFFSPSETRVVILGQDPYHTAGKACGLSFGINPHFEGRRDYSSFGNICKELEACGFNPPRQAHNGDIDPNWAALIHWAYQGVLLLNTRLSVMEGQPMSHAGRGWESVVPSILTSVLRTAPDAVWVCWGAEARHLAERLGVPQMFRLCSSHPTKYSAGRGSVHAPAFLGSKWPAEVNRLLELRDKEPIDWRLAHAFEAGDE